MKRTELRVGNLILLGLSEILEVRSIHPLCIIVTDANREIHFDSVRPIPLTEDWLEKFGFKNTDAGWSNGTKANLHKTVNGGYMLPSFGHHDFVTELKYVHQLQNLYFALTGKELEITVSHES